MKSRGVRVVIIVAQFCMFDTIIVDFSFGKVRMGFENEAEHFIGQRNTLVGK